MTNILFLPLSLLFLAFGLAEKIQVDQSKNNSVKFFAKTTFGSFIGMTDQIDGYITWEGDDTISTSKVHFEVDLASIDTGIDARNKDMREKYLETNDYPIAKFDGSLVKWITQNDSSFLVKVKGTLSMHGADQPFSGDVKLESQGGNYLVILNFDLDIIDFNIKRPKFLFNSMNEIVTLQLSFFMKP